MRWIPLADSEPHHGGGIKLVRGKPDPSQVIRATVVVRSRCSPAELKAAVEQHNALHPLDRPQLSQRDFIRRYGPLREDIAKVIRFAQASQLRVREVSTARHSVVLSGTLARFAKAFRVEFANYAIGGSVFIGHKTPIFVPDTLSAAVAAVLGFDDRPLSRPQAVVHRSPAGGVRPDEIARAYGYPAPRAGHAQTIAIMLPYGGFRRSDLSRFFKSIGRKIPRIRTLNVEGRSNQPAPVAAIRQFCDTLAGRTSFLETIEAPKARGVGSSPWNVLWSVEAALDIELAGALAPNCDLLACFIPDNPRGKFEGFARAITHPSRPAVVSCSWSAHESTVPPILRLVLDRLFMFATLRNITVCCSSGDDGGSPGERKQVHFPASSPYVLACGGSSFPEPSGPRVESVWNERVGGHPMSTSGGFSRAFPRPIWQRPHIKLRGEGRTGRAVPDVAAKADFGRGYEMVVAGRQVLLGGTSAATPAWAALVACINNVSKGRLGLITPLLYAKRGVTALHRVTKGGNGTYRALRGWDPCTGLGTPIGAALRDLLGRRPSAGARRHRAPRRSARG